MESGIQASLDNLTHLGLRRGVDMRPTLIRVLTDLYVQKLTHTPEEERHYTELAMRLLDAVDVVTRTTIAARLAPHLSPPVAVIRRLAADLPAVAAPLRSHPLLQHAAGQADAVETSVVAPAAAVPAQHHRGEISRERPRNDAVVAASDLTVPISAATAAELNELFFAADANERRLILLNLEVAAPLPPGRVSLPHDAEIALRLERAALGHDQDEFAQHLAAALAVPRTQARRIVDDELGEPIMTAAKALNLPRDVLYRILLFVNTAIGHSVERVHALATLFDEMTTPAALHMVAIWQALQQQQQTLQQQGSQQKEALPPEGLPPEELQKRERPAGRHQPLFWNDEARARARTASATVRRAPSTQRPGSRRDVS